MGFLLKENYNEYDLDNLKSSICDYVSCNSFTSVRLIVKSFLNFDSLYYDDCFKGLACINMDTDSITINCLNLVSSLIESVSFVLDNINLFSFLKIGENEFDYKNYVLSFTNYLVLHEIGHYLYTLPSNKSKPLITNYCNTTHIPFEFVHFVINVVEDCFIQRRFQLDYPNQIYRDIFFLGTSIIQGPFATQNYLKDLESSKTLSLYNKLFYLILRAYNLNDKDVQSMFNMNPVIGWTQEALDLFDEATSIIDSQARFNYTLNTLLPVLFKIVHEVVDSSSVSDTDTGGSLLESDKLYEANDSSKSFSSSESSSQDSNQESNGTEDTQDTADGSDSKNNLAENSSNNKVSNSSKQDNGEEKNSQNSAQNEANSSNESNFSISNDSDSSNEGSGCSSGDSSSLKKGLTEEEFLSELAKASEELSRRLDEQDKERNETRIKPVSNDELSGDLQGITRSNPISLSSMVSNNSGTSFSPKGVQLYNIASSLFKRIFTYDTDDLSYLDNGELDEDIMIDFYTEKSLNIFKQHIDLVESKNIYITFLVDDSGSMYYGNYYSSSAFALRSIIPPLIQAFEDSGIKCSLYTFSSNFRLVKGYDDPALYIKGKSNIQTLFNSIEDGGGTNAVPVLRHLCSLDYDNDNNIYICFTFTDGCLSDRLSSSELYKYLSKHCGVHLFGVTIEEDPSDLCRIMFCVDSSPFVINYSQKSLITKLPEDIYNTIINSFIKLK